MELRIVSDGTPTGTQVRLAGKPVERVQKIEWSLAVGGRASTKITIAGSKFELDATDSNVTIIERSLNMHPATQAILRFFTYDHLSGPPREMAKKFADFAHDLAHEVEDTPHGAELTTGLRKLMEAKDCVVRATLPAEQPSQAGPAHSISHRDQ